LNNCSTSQIPSYYNQISIDSTNIVASIQPIEYPWNTEGYLVDLVRKKYETNPPFMSPFNILLSFENIEPDMFSVYICLTHNNSCVKIAEQYFNGGLYSIGFQKLEIEPGLYIIKIISDEEEYSEQCLLESIPSN
jgi:hypothetical protein